MARIKDVLKNEEDELQEKTQQNQYESSSKKTHWRKIKKKLGPKNKEEDEGLREQFPDGQVSCSSNHHQFILILVFSVSAVSKNHHAGNSLGVQKTPPTLPSQRGGPSQVSMARLQLCKENTVTH